MTDQDLPVRPVVAAVAASLGPGAARPLNERERAQETVAVDWQMLGAQYEWAEIHGVTKGRPHGYFTDLVGRAAAAGELLGLAFTALRDAKAWRDTPPRPENRIRRSIAGRALAEASGLWAVSAGHAAVNVVARVVRLHSDAKSLDRKLKWTGLPTPFDTGRPAHLSLNDATTTAIIGTARHTNESALVALTDPLDALTRHAAWATLVARRHADSHRLRPQSIEGGVPSESPWTHDPTAGTLTLGATTTPAYRPPVLEDVVHETQAGYDALSSAMRDVHDRLPAALVAVGVPIWAS